MTIRSVSRCFRCSSWCWSDSCVNAVVPEYTVSPTLSPQPETVSSLLRADLSKSADLGRWGTASELDLGLIWGEKLKVPGSRGARLLRGVVSDADRERRHIGSRNGLGDFSTTVGARVIVVKWSDEVSTSLSICISAELNVPARTRYGLPSKRSSSYFSSSSSGTASKI